MKNEQLLKVLLKGWYFRTLRIVQQKEAFIKYQFFEIHCLLHN